MKEKIKEIYAEAQRKTTKKDIAVLMITDDRTLLVLDTISDAGVKTLPYGTKSLTADYFRHTPPTEGEIEAAITIVEDEIMPHVADIRTRDLQLVSPDKGIAEIMGYATDSKESMSVADVEGVFSRLAAIITGRPASMDNLPADNDFVSQVLILREVMHHLRFGNILIYASEMD